MFLPLEISDQDYRVVCKLNDDERQDLVKSCVHALLVLGQERTPIKKIDLNKLVFQRRSLSRTIAPAIIQLANIELNKIFGMRLYEFDDKTKILLINSKTDFAKYHNYDSQMREELTVLFFTLMDIFAAPDEKRSEDDLMENLIGIDCDRDELKGYFETFLKKSYLIMTKEQDQKIYAWGPRTIAEIDPENFFNQFLKLVGDTTDRDWPDLSKRIETLKNMPYR